MKLDSEAAADQFTHQIEFGATGVIPAVAQDDRTGEVLMVGFMNDEAVRLTASSGFTHFFSRSRNRIWKKGESSGHVQHVESIAINCDSNSLLLQVTQDNAVCHDGYRTCYYRTVEENGSIRISIDRTFHPALVYGPGKESVEQWFAAYEFLRDHVDPADSGTARLIRDPEFDPTERIADELRELAGVVDGSHGHGERNEDLVLESSQVLYWLMISAMQQHFSLDDLDIQRAFGPTATEIDQSLESRLIRSEADMYASDAKPASIDQLHSTMSLIAQVLANAGIDALAAIEFDLEQMRKRPHLAHLIAGDN